MFCPLPLIKPIYPYTLTVNFGPEMVQVKHVSGINIFCRGDVSVGAVGAFAPTVFEESNNNVRICINTSTCKQTLGIKVEICTHALQLPTTSLFCSMNEGKMREERIFEIGNCSFEGQPKMHHLYQPNGLVSWCQLGGNSKGQCTISKILYPLLLCAFIEQNIYFLETCFAYPISEKKFKYNMTLIKANLFQKHCFQKSEYVPSFYQILMMFLSISLL